MWTWAVASPATCFHVYFHKALHMQQLTQLLNKKNHLTIFCEAEKVCKKLSPGVSESPSVCLVSSGSASVAAGQTAEISERSERTYKKKLHLNSFTRDNKITF